VVVVLFIEPWVKAGAVFANAPTGLKRLSKTSHVSLVMVYFL